MPNVVSAIKEISAERQKVEAELKSKLAGYDMALAALRAVNTVCETCEGKGKVLRSRACAEDDRPDPADPNDWETCPTCHGTGAALHKREMTNPAAELLHSNQRGGIKLGDLEFR